MLTRLKTLVIGAALLAAGSAWAEAPIIFCTNFSDQFVPEGQAEEFTGTQVSWMTILDGPIGENAMIVSLYQNDASNSQTLLGRIKVDVNPKWTAYGVRNAVFPAVGNYEIAFALEDGTTIASGRVNLLEETPQEEIKPEEKYGTTLEELFNKYAPK